MAVKTDGTLWGAGAGNYSANGNVAGNHAADFAQIPIGNTVTKAAIGGTGSYNYCLALLLHEETLDRDLLDERARAVLGLAHPDEIIVLGR